MVTSSAWCLARISHEHCVNFEEMFDISLFGKNFLHHVIYTMFTKGQPIQPRMQRHCDK
jgi:hypothetical protein